MRLRTRLVGLTVGLCAVGLGAAGIAGNVVLHRLALQRIDTQLRSFGGRGAERPPGGRIDADPSTTSTTAGTTTGGQNAVLRCDRQPFTLPGALFELYRADGTQVCAPSATVEVGGGPLLTPAQLASTDRRAVTVQARNGDHRYRVVVQPGPQGTTAVLAIDLADTEATWRRQALATGGLGVALIGVLAASSVWLVRRELRPLEDVTDAVGSLAVDDLSRRVDVPSSDGEVGRLAEAFNTMVGRIDAAFSEQREVEERLRRFAADASHELRTPLSSIRGFAELHRRYPGDLEAEELAWRRVEEESTRMSQLVEDLLMLARHDRQPTVSHDAVDLGEVTRSAADALRVTAPDRPLQVDVDDDVFLLGDEGQLRRVVVNLTANAFDHTPAGTPVEVTLRAAPRGGDAELRVVDHGPGIPPDQWEHVFERFVRLDQSRTRASGGTGLGLAIVRSVVEAHGGRVAVRETPGGGATFVVRLPAAGGVGDEDDSVDAGGALDAGAAGAIDATTAIGAAAETDTAAARPDAPVRR